MSLSFPGFDIDTLTQAIDAGDRERVHHMLCALSDGLAGDGSRLYTVSVTCWILSELYARGIGARDGRHAEDACLNAIREVYRCGDRGAAFALLERFCMSLGGLGDGAPPRAADRQDYIRRAMEYMRQAYADPDLKLEEVAQHAWISASYLTLLIRQETGSTFSALLTQIRMEYAAEMLAQTNRRAYDVAARCGFASPTYFSTVFRQHFGVTPTEYRKIRGDS
ncbi:MAG: helix-turn-helix transcriptional regulator [Clostridia bacterium]|nr:helix-turn-helix transcriptional regulator [Clostridia bacterium]